MIRELSASEKNAFARHAKGAWTTYSPFLTSLANIWWSRNLSDDERVTGMALFLATSDGIYDEVARTGFPVEDLVAYERLMEILARYVLLATQPQPA
jgi:hypothetical protein